MAVSFNEIPSNIRVPLFYAEVDNSMANTATAEKKSLLIGQMISSGAAVAGEPRLITSVAQAKELFGRGSPLALMVEAFRNQNSAGVLWCLPMDIDDAVQATGTITVDGTASASGTIALYIGGVKVPVVVASGKTDADIATLIATAVNSKADLPVTAVAADEVVTLTAKAGGTSGNDIKIQKNLQSAVGGEEDVAGIELTIVAMADGAGEIDYASAFTNVETETYLFIGVQGNSSTILDAVKNEMNDSTGRWAYNRMQYGHVMTTKRGTSEALVTLGGTRNDQHVSIFGIEPSFPAPDYVVTGALLGRTATYITNDPARPLQTGPLNGLLAAPIKSRFGFADQQALLSNGIATLYVQSGTVMIQREITTYQKNKFGDADNSYLDATTLFTLAEIITTLKTAITSKYARHKLANDGTRFGAGQAIVTPSVIRSELIAQYAALETKGLVENADLFAKYLVVERDADDPNRINVLLPPDLVNQLRIFALLAQFRLQYSAQD